LNHFFNSPIFTSQSGLFLTSTINQLTSSTLNNFYLALPSSIEEQTIIANYLDHKTTQIDHLIAKKEQFIQLLEEERVAVINQAVTKGLDPKVPMKDSGIEWLGEIPAHWEVKKLKQIFNSSKGLTITKENLESEGIPCVNYGEIHSKFGFEVDIDKHQLKCVNPSYLESDFKSLIQTGDFVFADTSEDVSGAGNFTYLKSNHEIFAGYHTIILRAFCDIEPRYFAYQFDSIPYRTQIRKSVKGIKVFSITQGILKNTSLWIPTLEEQKQIIKFLDIETDRIVSIKNSTRKEIELLKEYKTALISEVVTGKVDVRNEKN
jgi:type I restriction enzyme S subunit